MKECISKRRSCRRFKPNHPDKELIYKLIDAARWAPSSCNEQLWDFIVVEGRRQRLVDEAGSPTLILNAPLLIAVYYYKGEFPANIESASAAVQNLLLRATDLGISSLWVGAVGNRRKINKILEVPFDRYLVCFILLGYRDGVDENPPPRRPIDEILHFENFKKGEIRQSHDPDKWDIKDISTHQRYYSRKTTLGKKMCVTNNREIELVRRQIQTSDSKKLSSLDLFSYDGSITSRIFKSNVLCFDLSDQTALYTSKAGRGLVPVVFDGKTLPLKTGSVSMITSFFKFESIPKEELSTLFYEARRVLKKNGEVIIAFRNMYSLYGVFYRLLVLLFRDKIRKTTIFTFFGPYKPLDRRIQKKMEKAGFKVTAANYFFIPPAFEEYSKLFLQYILSGGTSFLHRKDRPSKIVSIISKILDIQGYRRTPFGSVTILKAKLKGDGKDDE